MHTPTPRTCLLILAALVLNVLPVSAQSLVTSIDFNDGTLTDAISGKIDYDTGDSNDGPITFQTSPAKQGRALEVDFLRYLRIPLDVVTSSGGHFTVKYDYYHKRSTFEGSTLWHVHSFAVRDRTHGYLWSHGFRNLGTDFWSDSITGFAKAGSQIKGDATAIPDFDAFVWHEYVLVFSGNRVTWYVDGVFAYYQEFDRSFDTWDWAESDLTIGARFRAGSLTELDGEDYYRLTGGPNDRAGCMNAVFDNVRIWDGVLDPATIAAGVENLVPQEPFVFVETPRRNVPGEGDTYSLKIDSNTAWSFSGVPGWITVSPSSGTGPATVNIDVAPNPDASARTAVLDVSGQSHTVVQSVRMSSPISNAILYPDTRMHTIEHVYFDLKSPGATNMSDARADNLFITDGFNGVRTSIYGTRDRPDTANGKPAHPAEGVVDGKYYAPEIAAMRKALARNPDLIVFASKKLNGPYSFPLWVLNASQTGINASKYAIMLADYIEYMAAEGIPTHILGVDNERAFNEGNIGPDNFRRVVDNLRTLSQERGFPMPLIIGHEDFGPSRGNWMATLVANGWFDRLDLFGTHYYPSDRTPGGIAKLESDLALSGHLDRWHSELHWNSRSEVLDILEIEDGFASLLDCTDRGFNGLMWWAYARNGLRGTLMRELTTNLLGHQPIVVTDHDGQDILVDGKVHTRAFRKGNQIVLWVLNLNPENVFTDYAFRLATGRLAGPVTLRQWSEDAPEGVTGEAASIDPSAFRISFGANTVTQLKFAIAPDDLLFSESWSAAAAGPVASSGSLLADEVWAADLSSSAYVSISSHPALAGNALHFDDRSSAGATDLLLSELPVPVSPDSMAALTLKAKGVIVRSSEFADGQTRTGVSAADATGAYEIVFDSDRLSASAVSLVVKGEDGIRTIELGSLGDQAPGVTYDVTATFRKTAANQTNLSYTVHRNSMFWLEGETFVDTAVPEGAMLTFVHVQGQAASNALVDDLSVIGREPIVGVSATRPPQILAKGTSARVQVSVVPANATNQIFAWTVENPAIASVSPDGIITGLDVGTTMITGVTTDGSDLTVAKRIVVTGPR
jgi:O-glycosyl hydrolase